MSLLLSFFGMMPGWVKTPLVAGVAILGMLAYDRWIDDPAVAREARRDYVHQSEKIALEAQLELQRRLRIGAEIAAAEYEKQLADYQAAAAAENEKIEQEIAEYEARLEAAGRTCRLDDADVEWLQQP